jgi:H+/Cl- antiporter ClcA
MKYLVIAAFVGIIGSLASALVYLMKDKGSSNRMANALTMRIGLSVLLFLFVLFSYWMGWIKPTGLRLPAN